MTTSDSDQHGQARRRLLKALAATGGAFASATLLPSRWTKPVIDTVMLPLHAQSSSETIVGLFSTSSQQAKSIFDFVVPTLHAVPLLGIVIGNANFDLHWSVTETNFLYCSEGFIGSTPFDTSGKGTRTGDSLSDIFLPSGITVHNQTVGPSGIAYDVTYVINNTSGVAPSGGGGCFVNNTTDLRMSSPYSDERDS